MSKKNFITLVLSTVGGILFAIGMCMCLVTVWSMMLPGILIGIVGILLLLGLIPLCRGLTE